MGGKVFISYRRDDERATAARIRDRLAASFGERNVFMDVDNLQPGQRFDKELETALTQCDVFIAVIGNQWANILAVRQAADERDFVVDEIAAAIERGIPVIPVLVDSASLPQAEALRTSIAFLPLHQVHEVKHESFGRDVEALVFAIRAGRKMFGVGRGPRRRNTIVAALVAVAMIVGGIGVYFAYERLDAERQRVQDLADARAELIARTAREADEARLRAKTDLRKLFEAERRRWEKDYKRAKKEKPLKAKIQAMRKIGTEPARTLTEDEGQPGSKAQKARTKRSAMRYLWPVHGKVIQLFGTRVDGTHNDGINIAVSAGAKIVAAESGIVAYAGSELQGYGKLVLIRHERNWVTAYAHNNELLVRRGDRIRRGQMIAKAGRSGGVDQTQLHFELRKGSKPVNPLSHMVR